MWSLKDLVSFQLGTWLTALFYRKPGDGKYGCYTHLILNIFVQKESFITVHFPLVTVRGFPGFRVQREMSVLAAVWLLASRFLAPSEVRHLYSTNSRFLPVQPACVSTASLPLYPLHISSGPPVFLILKTPAHQQSCTVL